MSLSSDVRPEVILPTGYSNVLYNIGFSPDGGTLATITQDSALRFWDVQAGALLWMLPNRAGAVAFSPDGGSVAGAAHDELASGTSVRTIRVWNTRTGALQQTMGEHRQASVFSLAFSPDGKTLASEYPGDPNADETGGALRLWDVETGALRRTLAGHRGRVWSFDFSPDGKMLASGGDKDAAIRLWDVETGALQRRLTGHGEGVRQIVFSPDGRILGFNIGEGALEFWDVQTEALLWAFPDRPHQATSFSPDGAAVVISSIGEPMRLVDARTGKLKRRLKGRYASAGAWVFSPDGKTLATTDASEAVRVWDAETGVLRRTLMGQSPYQWRVAFSPDGRTLASGSNDGIVTLWNPDSGRLLASLYILPPDEEEQVATDWLVLTPEGYYVGSGGAERFLRWRVGDRVSPAEAYARTFHRPDRVQQALRGESLPPPQP